MIVCVCHRVSDREIEREVRAGCESFPALQDELGVGTACGSCVDCAVELFEKAKRGGSARACPAKAIPIFPAPMGAALLGVQA